MPELTAEQQKLQQQNIESYVRGQLNPPAETAHTSLLYQKKQQFLNKLNETLSTSPAYQDEARRAQKLQEAGKAFDEKMIAQAQGGAGGDARAYGSGDAQADNTAKGAMGVMGMIANSIGGFFGILWSFIQNLFPAALTDWMSGFFSSRDPKDVARENVAAGVADRLGATFELEGQEVFLTKEERGRLFRQMKDRDFTMPPEPKPAPGNPQAAGATLTPEQEEAARQSREEMEKARASGPSNNQPSGRPQTPPVQAAAGTVNAR